MSRHHEKDTIINRVIDKTAQVELNLLAQDNPESTRHNPAFEAIRGHGLFSTK